MIIIGPFRFGSSPSLDDVLRMMFPDIDEGDPDYEGYYCIQVKPEKCPCGKVRDFVEPNDYHLVIVWAEKDDDFILHAAAEKKRQGRNPRIVEYKAEYGPCIEFYEGCQEGMFPGVNLERTNR